MIKYIVTANSLNVREAPNTTAKIISQLKKDAVVDVILLSEDEEWYKIKASKESWVYGKYLKLNSITTANTPLNDISNIVSASNITNYSWNNRGKAGFGYYYGMALTFARQYIKLKNNDPYVLGISKAATNDPKKDVLAYYADRFLLAGMSNEVAGAATLRHVYTFLLGLGMRESSGKYCVGRDMNADNKEHDTCEAGLFQTSYNAIANNSAMQTVYAFYKNNPTTGFLNQFKIGIKCNDANFKNWGIGEGVTFQKLSKDCPAFATEIAANMMRVQRSHYGPINNYHVEIKPEANAMFLKIQNYIDSNNIESI